jgi:hypothetical protein
MIAVSGGVLRAVTADGPTNDLGFYWYRKDLLVDFSERVVLEARLRVHRSNHIPNIGSGTREGYYFLLFDRNSPPSLSFGLADTGFNINSISQPNQPLTPFLVADGQFHVYRVEIVQNVASFYIDGNVVASAIAPVADPLNADYFNVVFGPLAGFSRSDTELEYLCYNATPAQLPIDLDVKPGSLRNSVNTRSEGSIPVAILSTPTFDARSRLRQVSLRFGRTGDEQSLDFCNGGGEDVNGDGLPDVVCHFTTALTGFGPDDSTAVLKARTTDGFIVKGSDVIRVIR